LENYREYLEFGQMALESSRYNSACTLFFKSIVALCDIHLLRKEGAVPSSHSSRFRILKEKYRELYRVVDKDFPFYQDSYTIKLGKEVAELLLEDARKVKEIIDRQ
jgi:uncharacterized protein (UPF0332 family)